MKRNRKIAADEIESFVRGVRCRFHNGNWMLFFHVGGVRKAISTKTKDAGTAALLLDQAEQELTREGRTLSELSIFGARSAQTAEHLTVADAVPLFLDGIKGEVTTETLAQYKHRLEVWVIGRDREARGQGEGDTRKPDPIANLPVTRVARKDVRDLLKRVRAAKNRYGRQNSRNTAQGVFVAVSRLFSWLIDSEMLKDREGRDMANPAAKQSRHTKHADQDRLVAAPVRPFEQDEQDAVLKYLAKHHGHGAYAMVLVGLRAGLRISEIVGLQFDDVDLDRMVLMVQRHWTQKSGIVPGTKNKRDGVTVPKREVPLDLDPEELVPALRKQLQLRKEENLKHGWDSKWLFANGGGRPIAPPDFGERVWRPARKALKLTGHVFHDTRHTFASELLYATNGNVDFVARCLGDTIAVTSKTYLHVIERLKPTFPGALSRSDGNAQQARRLAKSANVRHPKEA